MTDDVTESGGGASQHGSPVFGPSVGPDHRSLDTGSAGDVYVVGDVHGCLSELRRLWERLAPGPSDYVVFVGDLVRKGPNSRGVVEFVAARDNAVSVRGNNEAKVLRGEVAPEWAEAVEDVLASFPLAVSWNRSMAVHGGVHPEWPLSEHEPDDILEMRAVPRGNSYDGPFWFESYEGGPRVFFGHTVLASPYASEWAVGLDTGCVYGGALTAYDCSRDRFLRVEADQTYRDRPAEKVVEH